MESNAVITFIKVPGSRTATKRLHKSMAAAEQYVAKVEAMDANVKIWIVS